MARTGDIPALTSVRGLAAVGVMTFHYRQYLGAADTIGHAAAARGYIFVDLFFLLSGFVMAKSYGERFARGFDRRTYAHFLGVRLARIYPVYVALLALDVGAAVARPLFSPDVTVGSALADLTLTQTWIGIHSTIEPAWSLSAEWAAYLAFPLLAVAFLSARSAAIGCGVAAAALAAAWGHDVANGQTGAHGLDEVVGVVTPMTRCFAGFSIGMCLHRLQDRLGRAGSDGFGAAVLALLAALWLTPWMPDLAIYACLPALLLCLALTEGRIAAALGARPMVLLGEWSYSIYLVHWLILRERERVYRVFAGRLSPAAADALAAAAFLGATIAVAAALHTWLEVPARDWIRSRLHGRRLPIALEPSAP